MKKSMLLVFLGVILFSCKKSKLSDLNQQMLGNWTEVSHEALSPPSHVSSDTHSLKISEETIGDVGHNASTEYTMYGNKIEYLSIGDGELLYTVDLDGDIMTFTNSYETRTFQRD